MHGTVSRALSVMVGLGAVFAVTGSMASEEFLELLYEDRFNEGPASSVGSLRWLSLSLGCVFAAAVMGAAMLAARDDRAALRIALVGLCLNAVGNVVLLPILGFEAAAMTTAVTEAWVLMATLRVFSRRHGPPRVGGDLVLALIPAAVLALILVMVSRSGGPVLFTAIGGAAVSGALVMWGPPGRAMRRALREV